jgi:hypothetical protein
MSLLRLATTHHRAVPARISTQASALTTPARLPVRHLMTNPKRSRHDGIVQRWLTAGVGSPLSARRQSSMIALGVVSSMWRPGKVEQPRTQCRAHYGIGTGRIGDGGQLAIAIDTAAPFLLSTQRSDR